MSVPDKKRKRLQLKADKLVEKLASQLHGIIAPNVETNDRKTFDRSLLNAFKQATEKISSALGEFLTDPKHFKQYSNALWERFSSEANVLQSHETSLEEHEVRIVLRHGSCTVSSHGARLGAQHQLRDLCVA